MSLNSCPFCEHGNPADAKICGACGGALTGHEQSTMHQPAAETTEQSGDAVKRTQVDLRPAGGADVPDPISANADLVIVVRDSGANVPDPAPAGSDMVIMVPAGSADGPDAVSASAEMSRPLSRRPTRLTAGVWAAGAVGMAVLGSFGYQVYKMLSYSELRFEKVPLSTAVSGKVTEPREAGAPSGTIGRDAAAGDTTPSQANDSDRPMRRATSPSETPLAAPARAAASQPRAGRQPVESRQAKREAAPTVSSRAINAGRASERVLSLPVDCTESVAALGLCPQDSVQTKEAEKAAAVRAPIARPQATETGKAGRQAPPRQEACTEAVAALGLCTP